MNENTINLWGEKTLLEKVKYINEIFQSTEDWRFYDIKNNEITNKKERIKFIINILWTTQHWKLYDYENNEIIDMEKRILKIKTVLILIQSWTLYDDQVLKIPIKGTRQVICQTNDILRIIKDWKLYDNENNEIIDTEERIKKAKAISISIQNWKDNNEEIQDDFLRIVKIYEILNITKDWTIDIENNNWPPICTKTLASLSEKEKILYINKILQETQDWTTNEEKSLSSLDIHDRISYINETLAQTKNWKINGKQPLHERQTICHILTVNELFKTHTREDNRNTRWNNRQRMQNTFS